MLEVNQSSDDQPPTQERSPLQRVDTKPQQSSIDRRWFARDTWLKGGFSVALLLLGSTSIASYLSIQRLNENRQWVEHTHQVLGAIDQTLDSIKNAERGRRGYIITSNDEFLETYYVGIQTAQDSLLSLQELTLDNPLQQQRFDQLERLTQQRFVSLQRSIVLQQQDPANQAAQIAITNRDRPLQQQIQVILVAMEEEEQQLLTMRSQAVTTNIRYTNLAVGISYFLSFSLLIAIVRLLGREIRQRRRAEAIIHQTNANLETLVQARTAELTQTNQRLQIEIRERQQVEAALSQSERYLQAIVDAEPECVKVITTEGTLLTMNSAGLAMLEADSLSQVQGQCVCALIDSAHQHAFLDFTQQVAQGRSGVLEFEITGLKGTRRWLESHAVPLPNADRTVIDVLAVTRDITTRKQAEAALQASEARLRLALEGANLGMWDYDLMTQAIEWTDRCKLMFGLALDGQVSYEMVLDAMHPNDRSRVDQAVAASIADRSQYDIEYRAQWGDGTVRWIAAKGRTVYDDVGQPVRMVGVTLDITDRKQAEFALQQAKAELEARVQERTAQLQQRSDEIQDLYNNAPCGYHSLDAEGRFVQVNDTTLRWLGYDRHELIGQPFSTLLTPSSLLIFEESFPQFKQQGWVNDLEFELCCKDGSVLWVSLNATAIDDDAGDYLMSRSTLFDIRDRKSIEAALRDSEAKFRSLSESSPNGVFMTDAHGQTIYTNPSAQTICGFSFEEALGTGWTRFVHPDDLPQILAQQEQAIAQPQSLIFSGIRYVHKDGTIRYAQTKIAPLLDVNSQLAGYVGTIEDITEQRQIDRMKNEFVSIVSHELRTPLTAIRGSLGLLANGVYDHKPEKGKKMLQLALSQTERLVRLVSDILDLKRLESGLVTLVMQSCEATTLMTQSAEAMRDLAAQNQITIAVTPLDIPVWAAPDAILQTIANLLSNAIKFSPAQTTIWLSAALDSSAPTPTVRFAVKDQGRGIPADKIESIFGQFQQVDASDSRQKGGTGLGLAICRHIIQQHGGRLWVESILGEGSTFYFTLAVTPELGSAKEA